ncbi:MAG: VIT1/CCC1 transporter family protein [Candidatus Falkowbacteria bacterium]
MKHSVKKGFSFGLTSGIITTLGLIVGLNSSTHSTKVIIGGILVIAIADALSDALGIHISEESEGQHTDKEVWEATAYTFLSKFVFALTFLIPILLFSLPTAIIVSIIWGLSLIAIFSFYVAKQQAIKPYKTILEHLIIAILVITITHFVGDLVANFN